MHGYAASGGSAAAARGGGSPGPHNQEATLPRAKCKAGSPLLMGHPKRSRTVRGGGAKRVSPPSAESYGGPIMLPLQDLRYHQVQPLLLPACWTCSFLKLHLPSFFLTSTGGCG